MHRRISLSAALATLASLSALSVPASARTYMASGGRAMNGPSQASFNSPNGIVYNTTSTSETWVMPLMFDNAGARTITVRGKANVGAVLSCQAIAWKTDGTSASISSVVQFPANGQWTAIVLSLTSIPGSSVGAVSCVVSGPSNAQLLGLDYLQ